eukprot:CAMPEP_0170133684 /NCGR_PEP_ID=MMETSP0033_2-20121228/1479_1 /TAXON_ID=195969 /ORGANISM="Dolichomastix tenuilepis, Strain CCMP3274" /LENGTH=112 /DNA_ID=CAMNT_0010369203 /DNA_START=27 /DNA_END=365 /DNA_ORIENTATION=-
MAAITQQLKAINALPARTVRRTRVAAAKAVAVAARPETKPLALGAAAVSSLAMASEAKAADVAAQMPQELMQVAGIGKEIATTSVTCFVITLVGLVFGFVLLRVEASVEGTD